MTGETPWRRQGDRASADALLHREMRRQSLRTSWPDFAHACERLIVWRSFALWVRAIVEIERGLPAWLKEPIDQRCPGFLRSRQPAAASNSIWLDFSAWIDDHVFAAARVGGWIDALYYYSGRDPRAEQIWSYWTQTEAGWRKQRPQIYPTFDEWHRDALTGLDHATEGRFSELVAQYIEADAFAFWARLIVEKESEFPHDVAAAIEKQWPGFLIHIAGEKPAHGEYSTWFWRNLLAWIENHAFGKEKEASSLDAIRDAARTHLRGERIAEYWADCSSRWQKNVPVPYPGFEQWLYDADAFILR